MIVKAKIRHVIIVRNLYKFLVNAVDVDNDLKFSVVIIINLNH